jgi:hypothetical protein
MMMTMTQTIPVVLSSRVKTVVSKFVGTDHVVPLVAELSLVGTGLDPVGTHPQEDFEGIVLMEVLIVMLVVYIARPRLILRVDVVIGSNHVIL